MHVLPRDVTWPFCPEGTLSQESPEDSQGGDCPGEMRPAISAEPEMGACWVCPVPGALGEGGGLCTPVVGQAGGLLPTPGTWGIFILQTGTGMVSSDSFLPHPHGPEQVASMCQPWGWGMSRSSPGGLWVHSHPCCPLWDALRGSCGKWGRRVPHGDQLPVPSLPRTGSPPHTEAREWGWG